MNNDNINRARTEAVGLSINAPRDPLQAGREAIEKEKQELIYRIKNNSRELHILTFRASDLAATIAADTANLLDLNETVVRATT